MPSHVIVKPKKQKFVKKFVPVPPIKNKPRGTEVGQTNETQNVTKLPIVEQEIKFARSLASNDPTVRNKVLKNLKKWLTLRSKGSFGFTDGDFLRLWKGLWYCMWMSDKPLTQEKLADDLANLVHCFENSKISVQFFGSFLITMAREWFGIDQWRMDKFMMLVRRVLRQILFKLAADGWSNECIEDFGKCLGCTIYDEQKSPIGLIMHFNDIYLEEIAKVSEESLESETVHGLIEPCIIFFAKSKDLRLIKHTKRNIFYKLLMQSELGQKYQEKYEIWKRTNFPCSSLDDLEINMEVVEEKNDEEDDEDVSDTEETSLDVRAGRVNVILHELKFDAHKVMELFEKYRFKEFTNAKSRREIKEILSKYRKFAEGEFPLGCRKIETVKDALSKFEPFDPDAKAEELIQYEEDLAQNSAYIPERIKRKMEWKKKRVLGLNEVMEEKSKSPTKKLKQTEEENKENSQNDEQEMKKKKQLKVAKESSSEWDKPLEDGEVEIFLPSRKQKVHDANLSFHESKSSTKEGKKDKKQNRLSLPARPENIASSKKKPSLLLKKKDQSSSFVVNPFATKVKKTSNEDTPTKKVKITLQNNMAQDTDEYIESIKNSPQIPYDANKKPKKGLLKPNLLPSPINPFYKKKIGFKLNESI